jgi:hypothetical protein
MPAFHPVEVLFEPIEHILIGITEEATGTRGWVTDGVGRCWLEPVWALIRHFGTPNRAASVAKPARSEWPE